MDGFSPGSMLIIIIIIILRIYGFWGAGVGILADRKINIVYN